MENNPEARSMVQANSHLGVTNIIEQDAMQRDLTVTFEKIFSILSKHYGPYGKFAMLVDPNNPLQEPIHTKDGINILRYIEMVSPMERVIKNAIAHIGKAVEMSAGDGTTSSMMLVCATLELLIKNIKKSKFSVISHGQLKVAYDAFVKLMQKFVDDNHYTLDKVTKLYDGDRKRAIFNIAYWQAYSSSHGDVELSNTMAELFSTMPELAWKYLTYKRDAYESDVRFKVVKGRGQFETEARVINPCCYNKDQQTWFKSEDNAAVYFINGALSAEQTTHIPLWDSIRDPKDEKIVIIMHGIGMSSDVHSELRAIVAKNPNNVAVFFITPHEHDIDILPPILATQNCSTKIQGVTPLLIEGAEVEFQQNMLYINGLFETNEKGENPDSRDTQHQVYDQISYMLLQIKQLENVPQNSSVIHKIKNLRRLICSLIIGKRPELLIGGLAYDNVAATDVVDDCVRAIMTVMNHGFVIGGNKWLYKGIDQYMTEPSDPEDPPTAQDNLIYIIAGSFRTALNQLFHMSLMKLPESMQEYLGPEFDPSQVSFDFLDPKYQVNVHKVDQAILDWTPAKGSSIIIQPISLDIEILERFGEVALKYVMTERIITKNAAYIEKE